jgi:hypothetical protein
LKKKLTQTEIPLGTEALDVSMRREWTFSKGPFVLKLFQECTGTTNVETEQKVLANEYETYVYLETVDPELLLQSRCTDTQLGIAIAWRLQV